MAQFGPTCCISKMECSCSIITIIQSLNQTPTYCCHLKVEKAQSTEDDATTKIIKSESFDGVELDLINKKVRKISKETIRIAYAFKI